MGILWNLSLCLVQTSWMNTIGSLTLGNLKQLETWLRNNFDHKTLVAEDDPMLPLFQSLQESNTIDMVIVKGTGTEMFAKMAMDYSRNLIEELYGSRCWVESVTVREHGANSATCQNYS